MLKQPNNQYSHTILFLKTKLNVHKLNAIYSEISNYNDIFWSRYLCILWFTLSAMISTTFYISFLSNSNIINKIALFTFFMVFSLILLFIIRISSLIYIEANNSYKMLNSIIASTIYSRNFVLLKLKVCLMKVCLTT